MNFKLIFSIAAFLMFAFQLLAQEKEETNEMLKNGAFFKLSINIPDNNFSKIPNDVYIGSITTKRGIGFDIGSMFFLNKISLGKYLTLGIDITYLSVNYTMLKGEHKIDGVYGQKIDEYDYRHLTFSTQFGSFLTTQLSKETAIDIGFKVGPTLDYFYRFHSPENQFYENPGVSLGTSIMLVPNLVFRYNMLLVGLEYLIGSAQHTDYRKRNPNSTQEAIENIQVPLNQFRILVGVKF